MTLTIEQATVIISLVIFASQMVGAIINNKRYEALRRLIEGKDSLSERLATLEERVRLMAMRMGRGHAAE